MKTITFFSEKGGVGKSSFSIMYASWLHQFGVKVGLADFNFRIRSYRNAEIKVREDLRKDKPEIPPYNLETAWPIEAPTYKMIDYLKNDNYVYPYASWFELQISDGGPFEGYDVIVCDFPGSINGEEFKNLLSQDYIKYVVIPTERDQMVLESTLRVNHALSMKESYVNHCVFLNKANFSLINYRELYIKYFNTLVKKGLPMLPDVVTYSEKMMHIEKVSRIRSTFGYPDFDLPEFGKSKDLGIGNLFIDVTRELAKTDDIKDTGKADLSFVNKLEKKPENRQFNDSAYPEYEI